MGNAVPQDRNRAVNETVFINLLKKLNNLRIKLKKKKKRKHRIGVVKIDYENLEMDLTQMYMLKLTASPHPKLHIQLSNPCRHAQTTNL